MDKRLLITMGEPGGIGPEIVLKALLSPKLKDTPAPIAVGSRDVFLEAASLLGLDVKIKTISGPDEASPALNTQKTPGTIELIEAASAEGYTKGKPSAQGGLASVQCIKAAVALVLKGKAGGIVTAPISKEALRLAGFNWPGHTEMLAELTGTTDFAMVLAGGPLKVILATTHTSYKSVPALITQASVLKAIRLAGKACKEIFGNNSPRIAVCGLNPHAGEAGLFGNEEAEIILPAIESAQHEGLRASGPYPPDTVFLNASQGEFDMVVAMYHDQGLIPLKLLAFHTGINITVGLPFLRTSPDHGTAYDIAWQKGGQANPSSMLCALALCLGQSSCAS